jgi:hypothetical protein
MKLFRGANNSDLVLFVDSKSSREKRTGQFRIGNCKLPRGATTQFDTVESVLREYGYEPEKHFVYVYLTTADGTSFKVKKGCIIMGKMDTLNFFGPAGGSYQAARSAWNACTPDE